MSPVSLLWFLLFSLLTVFIHSAANVKLYPGDFSDLPDCGSLGKIGFPFTTVKGRNSGLLAIDGCNNSNQTAEKRVWLDNNKTSKQFQVTKINIWPPFISISIIDQNFSQLMENQSCNAFSYNITLPPSSPFGYFYIQNNIFTFKCSRKHLLNHTNNIINYTACSAPFDYYFAPPSSDQQSLRSLNSSCSMVQLPKRKDSQFFTDPFGFLTSEITFQFMISDYCNKCFQEKEGHCQLDSKQKLYCDTTRNEPPKPSPVSSQSRVWSWKLPLILGVGPWIIFGLIFTLRHCKQKYDTRCIQLHSSNSFADPYPNCDRDTDRMFFGVPVFSYKELQEATNNFDRTRKLGDGGFGSVYYGTLGDGREVAIKLLFENNYKRVEQFMNEIEILTRLRHRNLVALYGCTSRHDHELLLVYEYIPNGTVASHIHGDLSRVGLLTWPIRMQIAIDTATALAYLHASNIIHRDVKTNNILLDVNFAVKVADFGLSRLLPNDASHVSTAPQGSPGYLDPEYFQCYRLTDKSDVYSFGVVLIELISSMPAVDATRERDEINLSNLAMKKIQKGKLSELVDSSFGFESDEQVKRVITSVAELAFRCMQADNGLRPSMEEVLETLKKTASVKCESEEHLEKGSDIGVISSISTKAAHSPPPASQNWGQVAILLNNKLSSLPKPFAEKWESEFATPNASG